MLLTTGVLLMAAVSLTAQEVRVTARPDTTVILIGDQTGFTVTAELPAGMPVSLRTAADTLAGKIYILKRDERDTTLTAGGKMTITDRYLITAFDSGSYTIPPFYAESLSGDSLLRFYSDYSFLDVRRPDIVLADTTDVIFDIVPPRGAPVTFREVMPWLLIMAVSALIIWALVRYLPRNPLSRFIRPPAPPEPAHVIALRALNELRAEELWQKGEVKEYHSRLSDILRRYIDNRYGICSPELTTGETVHLLQRAGVTTPAQMKVVSDLLSLADMVKFAKYIPDAETNSRSIDQATAFVEETRLPDEDDLNEKSAGQQGTTASPSEADGDDSDTAGAGEGGSHA